ncbi:MAG: AMP-binding protein [Burkholderiaceae bacterium]|nr:AMP-binding protein [Burkholderiaceae bacterium]
MLPLVDWGATDRPALITDAGQSLTYGELHTEVAHISKFLPRRKLVFLVGRNDIPTVATYLACLETGCVPLLLSPDIFATAFSRLLSTYLPAYVFLPSSLATNYSDLETVLISGEYNLCRYLNGVGPDLHPELALLLATSGSTGSPKLVRLSGTNIFSNARSIVDYLGINEYERAITSLPFNYSYGMSVVNSHLNAGASVLLTNRSFFDPLFWRLMKSNEVTSLAGVPYSYEILLKLRFQRMDLPALRTLTQAGGKLSVPLTEWITDICNSKGIRFFTMYGQTEASPRMTYLQPEYMRTKIGSIGRAVPGGVLWLEDSQGNPIEQPDEIGELIFSGPNVALGYALSHNDLVLGDEWQGVLRTGDLAKQDIDGFFFIEGRSSRFLKIFGVRISLDAVEAWYAERGIVAAAYGQDDHLKVMIEATTSLLIDDETKQLAEIMKIHPSAIMISRLPILPRLNTGKIDYSCLNSRH